MQLSVNGTDIFVATGGREFDESQPTIVLLHGAGFDHTTWALHSRWFAHHGYGVLAPALPAMDARQAHLFVRSPTWPTGPPACSRPQVRQRQGLSVIPWGR